MPHHAVSSPVTPTKRGRFARLRSALASLATVSLIASGMVIGATTTAQAAGTTGGTVTGTVYRDFNSNGTMDTGNSARSGVPNDVGLAGVTVAAYDRDGDPVGTATSGADGTYTLTVAGAASTALRLEFGSLSPFDPAFAGAGNGTSVQFVQVGATGVDYAVNAADEYTSEAKPLVTTVYSAGTPEFSATGGNANAQWNQTVVAIPWAAQISSSTGQANGSHPYRNLLANFSEVGAVGSTVVDSNRNQVLVASSYKRHSGLKDTIDTILDDFCFL